MYPHHALARFPSLGPKDDQYDFEGHHCLLQRGYGTVLQKLADGLDIRYGHPVESLHYDDDGVRVTTSNGEAFEGDIVLVTLPLGVLKQGYGHPAPWPSSLLFSSFSFILLFLNAFPPPTGR